MAGIVRRDIAGTEQFCVIKIDQMQKVSDTPLIIILSLHRKAGKKSKYLLIVLSVSFSYCPVSVIGFILRQFESYLYFTSYFLSPTYSSAVYNVSVETVHLKVFINCLIMKHNIIIF